MGARLQAVVPPVFDQPVGIRARGFLRRVVIEGDGSLHAERNAEREAGEACVNAGLLNRDQRDPDLFHISEKGRNFLSRLAGAL